MVIANGTSPTDAWRDAELRATVPNGAVEARLALVFRQPNAAGGAVHVDDVLFGRRGDYSLYWDQQGDGNWISQRWSGAALDHPTDFDRAIIRSNQVVVTGNQSAFETVVESGILDIRGQLSSNVNVGTEGTIGASGASISRIVGTLNNSGVHQLGSSPGKTLFVTGAANIAGARIVVGDNYLQPRGTTTGQLLLISAATVTGTFTPLAGSGEPSYLGRGHFLHDIQHTPDSVLIDVYAALPGDANGDGVVDGQDFIVWNTHKFQSGTDWLSGDFNGDGITDGSDFIIWNDYKFSTANLFLVPEPTACLWAYTLLMAILEMRSLPD
jgi:hypothetical protein